MERQNKKLKLRQKLLVALGLWSSIALSGCASSPPDIPVCVELTPVRGYCVNTISNKEFYFDDDHTVNGETFWDAKPTMIMLPYSSWAQLKAWIIKECKITGACDSRIASWDRTLNSVDQIVREK